MPRLYRASADTIALVAAVILRGEILHSGDLPGAWGVLSLDDDEFCKRSGKDSPIWSGDEEAAERQASRLTLSSTRHITYVAAPVERAATVGPYAVAGEEPGVRFSCLLWPSGQPSTMQYQVVPFADGDGLDHTYEDDYSAFAAARAFVLAVGENRARDALEKLRKERTRRKACSKSAT